MTKENKNRNITIVYPDGEQIILENSSATTMREVLKEALPQKREKEFQKKLSALLQEYKDFKEHTLRNIIEHELGNIVQRF